MANEFDQFDEVVNEFDQFDEVTPSVSALPESQVQRTLIDIGRGAMNMVEGVEQINKEGNLKNLEAKSLGNVFYDKKLQMARKPTKAEQEMAKVEFEKSKADYDNWVRGRENEIRLYKEGTEGRKWSALAGELVGESMTLPVGGPIKTAGQKGWALAAELSRRLGTEAGIGGTSAGLTFVPEGLSREENILFGATLGLALRGGIDSVAPVANKFKEIFAGKKPTAEEARQLLANIRNQSPETMNAVDAMVDGVDSKFIDEQLATMPKEQRDALTEPMKERLAVFNFMNVEPTRGQLLRDPMMMAEEIKLSTTGYGEAIYARFEQQRKAAADKLKEITGYTKSKFGSDVLSVFDDIKQDWLSNNNALYKAAVDASDPNQRFTLDTFTSTISDIQERLNISPNAMAALKEINRKIANRLSLPNEVSAIEKQMMADFGDNAIGQAYKLMELQKLTDGINAQEVDELIVKTFNDYKSLPANDKALFSQLKESVLNDQIAGTGADAFAEARKNFAEMQSLIKQFPIMEKLGFYQSGKAQKEKLSDEQIFKKTILDANNKDFNAFMDLLDSPKYAEKLSPLKDSLRMEVFDYLKREAMTGNLDRMNNPTFQQHKFNAALDKLVEKGGKERLARILTQDEIMALTMIKRYGQMIQEMPPRKSLVNPSNTAAQALAGTISILNKSPAGRALLGIYGEGSEFVANALKASEARRVLQGAAIPREMAELDAIANPANATPESIMQEILRGGQDVGSGVLLRSTGLQRPVVPLSKALVGNEREEKRRKNAGYR